MHHDTHAYRSELAFDQLVSEVRGLLGQHRAAEQLVCRYLADMADRIAEHRLGVRKTPFADIQHAASCLFRMSTLEFRDADGELLGGAAARGDQRRDPAGSFGGDEKMAADAARLLAVMGRRPVKCQPGVCQRLDITLVRLSDGKRRTIFSRLNGEPYGIDWRHPGR